MRSRYCAFGTTGIVAGVAASRLGADCSRAAERLLEAFVVEWLDQVVERGQVERLQRMLIVRGDEDRRRHCVGTDRSRDLEARFARHLHVEKQ